MTTNQEQMKHYLRLAKEAEEAATAVQRRIGDRIRRDLFIKVAAQPQFWKGRDIAGEIDFLTTKAASTDPNWKTQVARNQWYIQQSIMYGTAANTDLLSQLVRMLQRDD